MTNHKKLTDREVHAIANHYASGASQDSIAHRYGVSRRTIGRVLRDAGCTSAQNVVSELEMNMVHQLRKYSLDARTLRVLLKLAYPEVK